MAAYLDPKLADRCDDANIIAFTSGSATCTYKLPPLPPPFSSSSLLLLLLFLLLIQLPYGMAATGGETMSALGGHSK